MNIMYKVKPIFGAEEVSLPDNMYYVAPIADFEPFDSTFTSNSVPVKVAASKVYDSIKTGHNTASMNKENKKMKENISPLVSTAGDKSEKTNQKDGKKSKKGKSAAQQSGGKSKNTGQSSSKESAGGNEGDKDQEAKDDLRPIIPLVCDSFLGNIIGDFIVQDFAIQVDFDYKPLRVLKVINHLRKNFGLRIAVKVYISSTVLVEAETNVDEWKMFETFESTILPRQDNQLVVTLIVKRFTLKEAWLNKQPFMIFDPFLGTAIYGEVNIARHITRAAQKFCSPCLSIYPENDPGQVDTVNDIDETLNAIQKFLFTRDLHDKQARPQIPELKDRRLKDNNDLDFKFTLDYILLLSLKL